MNIPLSFSGVYTCCNCKLYLKSHTQYKDHMKYDTCNTCGRCFPTRIALLKHRIRFHHNERMTDSVDKNNIYSQEIDASVNQLKYIKYKERMKRFGPKVKANLAEREINEDTTKTIDSDVNFQTECVTKITMDTINVDETNESQTENYFTTDNQFDSGLETYLLAQDTDTMALDKDLTSCPVVKSENNSSDRNLLMGQEIFPSKEKTQTDSFVQPVDSSFIIKSEPLELDTQGPSNYQDKIEPTVVHPSINSTTYNTQQECTSGSDMNPVPHTCDNCATGYPSKDTLMDHMLEHTVDSKLCTICKRRFFSRDSLLRHVKQHTSCRRYMCPMCKKRKTFIQQGTLEEHLIFHKMDRKFTYSNSSEQTLGGQVDNSQATELLTFDKRWKKETIECKVKGANSPSDNWPAFQNVLVIKPEPHESAPEMIAHDLSAQDLSSQDLNALKVGAMEGNAPKWEIHEEGNISSMEYSNADNTPLFKEDLDTVSKATLKTDYDLLESKGKISCEIMISDDETAQSNAQVLTSEEDEDLQMKLEKPVPDTPERNPCSTQATFDNDLKNILQKKPVKLMKHLKSSVSIVGYISCLIQP